VLGDLQLGLPTVESARDSEVEDPRPPLLIDKDIIGLKITMNQIGEVGSLESSGSLEIDLENLLNRHR
jgi:hypothetical protein